MSNQKWKGYLKMQENLFSPKTIGATGTWKADLTAREQSLKDLRETVSDYESSEAALKKILERSTENAAKKS